MEISMYPLYFSPEILASEQRSRAVAKRPFYTASQFQRRMLFETECVMPVPCHPRSLINRYQSKRVCGFLF